MGDYYKRLGLNPVSPDQSEEILDIAVQPHEGRRFRLKTGVANGFLRVLISHYPLWCHDSEATQRRYHVDECGDGGEKHREIQALAMEYLSNAGYNPQLEARYFDTGRKISDLGDTSEGLYVECGKVSLETIYYALGLRRQEFPQISLDAHADEWVELLLLIPYQPLEAHFLTIYGLSRGENT